MLKLGWKAGPEQFPPVELMEYAIEAENAGFELIDVSDHFHPWSEQGQSAFTWTWLGAVAARTQRITLSPGVTCPILLLAPSPIGPQYQVLDNHNQPDYAHFSHVEEAVP